MGDLDLLALSNLARERTSESRHALLNRVVDIRTIREEKLRDREREIIDDILLAPEFLHDYLDVMTATRIYLVGVRCPLEVIAEREALRPGRFPGTAESHFHACHAHGHYDVEVDTSTQSPAECADTVIARIGSGPPEAFERLRAGQ